MVGKKRVRIGYACVFGPLPLRNPARFPGGRHVVQTIECLLDDLAAGIRCNNGGDPQLMQMTLGGLVTGRVDAEHHHRAVAQMIQCCSIQGAQVRRDQSDLGKARSCDGKQICKIGTASDDLGVRATLKRGDQCAFPTVTDRRDD
jgi:hypothetical protein